MHPQDHGVLLEMPMDSMARMRLRLRLMLVCAVTTCLLGLSPMAAIANPKLSESTPTAFNTGSASLSLGAIKTSQAAAQSLTAQQSLDMRTDRSSLVSPAPAQALSKVELDAPEIDDANDAIDLSRYAFLEPLDCPELGEKTAYTITETCSLKKAVSNWGVSLRRILSLNPELSLDSMLSEGQSVVVQTRTPWSPVAYSRGKASRGSLRNACIMPEGEGYFLRTYRPNNWGTALTIESIVAALAHYAQAYPGAARVNIGDLSKRRGGRIRPHASHQSGRDVDLGFIHKGETSQKHPEHFKRANADNLDVEKTWAVIEALIRTGNVEVIYIDKFVQKALYQHAKNQLTPQQIEAIFSLPRHPASSSAKLMHWPGHRNHAHVRFRCPDGQMACRR